MTHKSALVFAITMFAIGAAALVRLASSPTPTPPSEIRVPEIIESSPDAVTMAPHAVRSRIYSRLANSAGELRTDLIGAPCSPGDTCSVLLTLPKGYELGAVELDDGAPGTSSPFTSPTVHQTMSDQGELVLEIIAQSTAVTPRRILGMVTYRPSPASLRTSKAAP